MICNMPRGSSIKHSSAEDGEKGEMKSLEHQARLCETVFEQTKKIYIFFLLSGHDSPMQISLGYSNSQVLQPHQNLQIHLISPLRSYNPRRTQFLSMFGQIPGNHSSSSLIYNFNISLSIATFSRNDNSTEQHSLPIL